MPLGERSKCWTCWEKEAHKYQEDGKGSFSDFKQFCLLYRGKKKTILEGCYLWLCRQCRKNMIKK